jgi:hypothetical protein
MQQSAADAVAGVTHFATPLHEQFVMTGSGAGTTVAVPGPSEMTAATILMQRPPSQAPAAVAGVQDPGLPEAGDESSRSRCMNSSSVLLNLCLIVL